MGPWPEASSHSRHPRCPRRQMHLDTLVLMLMLFTLMVSSCDPSPPKLFLDLGNPSPPPPSKVVSGKPSPPLPRPLLRGCSEQTASSSLRGFRPRETSASDIIPRLPPHNVAWRHRSR